MKNIIKTKFQILTLSVMFVISVLWIGCTQKTGVENTSTSNESNQIVTSSTTTSPQHEHKPPHHGTLVVLGQEFSHVEMVLDSVSGKLTAYALDGEAENPVKLSQKEIQLDIILDNSSTKKNFTIKLASIPNVLTGETVGDSSEFSAQTDNLKGVHEFNAILSSVNIRGSEFKNVTFNFPKGNDTD